MKISEMNTNQVADVLVRIAEPAANIMHDKNVFDMLEKLATGNDASPIKFFADNIALVVMVLLNAHRNDVFEIVAALSEKTVDDVGNQNIKTTVIDIKESVDKDLLDFFGSLK